MCLMIMKSTIQKTLQGYIPNQESDAKEYLNVLEKKFTKNKKIDVGILLCKFTSTKYKDKVGVREHFTKMIKLQRALKEHGYNISDSFS